MNTARHLRSAAAIAGYALAVAVVFLALGKLATWIAGTELADQAQRQLARVESGQPLWQWRLQEPRDVIARRAFGHAALSRDDGALRFVSDDGTPFEVGLPVAWALDLAHWPILQLQLQAPAAGTLGLIWQGPGSDSSCIAPTAARLNPGTDLLRIDLRGLAWHSADGSTCPSPGMAHLLRLRVQIPQGSALRLASAALSTTEPMPRFRDTAIALPSASLDTAAAIHALGRAQGWPMPLFQLPHGIDSETMLSLRDALRQRWPAALIVPAGVTPNAVTPATTHDALAWTACAVYLLALAGLLLRPAKGRWRPWLELAGCLLGPLWLVMGLHWRLHPTGPGVAVCGAGIVFALLLERRRLSRLWSWSIDQRGWWWPFAAVPVTLLLLWRYGHAPEWPARIHIASYLAWALFQQWLMLVVILSRIERIVHRPAWAALAVAILFALLHTPNGMLMQLCFAAELGWAWCYLRSRSVLPVGLAHAACALLVEAGLSGSLLRSLEISGRFFL